MEKNCRTCLSYLKIEDSFSVNLNILENNSVLDLIRDWSSLEVPITDKLPAVICQTCYQAIQCFAEFIMLIRKSHIKLKEWLYQNKNDDNAMPQNITHDKLRERVRHGLREIINQKSNPSSSSNRDHKEYPSKSQDNEKLSSNSNKCIKEVLKQPSIDLQRKIPRHYKCLNCPKIFKSSHQYKMHMTVHTGEKKYLCNICGKYFSRSYVLMYHMRVHTGEKKFNCNICGKSFTHPSNLYKHKKIHTGRNYKCASCNKWFVQSEALKIHIRTIHTGEKPFLCEICSKSFSSQSALWVHKQDRHNEKESCEICHKQFSSRILKQHVKRHKDQADNVKKCICEQCGKNFSTDHNLKRHLLSHNGIKPYASQPFLCPLCKKMYSKRRIKSHICIGEMERLLLKR